MKAKKSNQVNNLPPGFQIKCRLIKQFTNFIKNHHKKQLVLMACAAMFSITAANAQGGGGQRLSFEERIKTTIKKWHH